jgi:hypothetical protein
MNPPHRNLSLAIVIGLATALLLMNGCSAPSPVQGPRSSAPEEAPGPDPSARILIGESPELEEVRGVPDPGVIRIFSVRGTHNQLTLYFEPRTDDACHRDLAAYSAWADNLLNEREIRTVEVGRDRNPVKEAGFACVAKTYVNVQRPGEPPPTSICDAAGFRFETPGGFWTVSCNTDRGKVQQGIDAINECLRVMSINRANRQD